MGNEIRREKFRDGSLSRGTSAGWRPVVDTPDVSELSMDRVMRKIEELRKVVDRLTPDGQKKED